jgi:hypothetical protein
LLRAASESARRRSKRLLDLADARASLEAFADLARGLTADERVWLDRLCPDGSTPDETEVPRNS